MLDQIARPIGAYDGERVYRAVVVHSPSADVIIPLRSSAVAMMRCIQVIGRSLRARTLPAQKADAAVGCKVMNIMTSLGMPISCKVV
ncbi:hypothetical protein J2848_002604 [Azospirillum lipoferum]|nr:hypothetical protein [Azospirillum lipoferum]